MNQRSKFFRTVALQVAIFSPLLFNTTGCVYVPFFEHRLDSGPNIRALVGDADSQRAIRPGTTTRAQVLALLGPAPYASADNMALGYADHTGFGIWFVLLGWVPLSADERSYVVRLVFDRSGTLVHLDWASAFEFGMHSFGEHIPDNLDYEAVSHLFGSGPILQDVTRLAGKENEQKASN